VCLSERKPSDHQTRHGLIAPSNAATAASTTPEKQVTAAIYYHPDAYTAGGPKLMGRNVAGESFLRGFLRHSKSSEFWVRVEAPDDASSFATTARASGRTEPVNVVDKTNLARLSRAGALYYPDPLFGPHAWQRAHYGHERWSLTGITHTTASIEVASAIVDMLTFPVQPWDALICTSAAVKNNVECLLQAQEEYLRRRLGITRVVLPQLPVIPLGVHVDDFSFTSTDRENARKSLGVSRSALIVLFVGRLSFHAKAYPLAMYQALEKATGRLAADQQVVLVECGWYANDDIRKAFIYAALSACPNVLVKTLDGREAESRRVAWASADIFCSLADNIQETFGITPVEAMAAGLPSVVSDWNGYRDTIRDGVDGFRVPTLMPESGLGDELAAAYALGIETYDRYCGYNCMMVAVDVEATALAFDRLFASAELRRQMGDAGRRRAWETFDWSAIIPRYESLWATLADLRKTAADQNSKLTHPWPAAMDPFAAFAGHRTRALTAQTHLALVDKDAETALGRVSQYRALSMVAYASHLMPTEPELRQMLALSEAGPTSGADLIAKVEAKRQRVALRGLVWLVKLGVMKVVE
jgi:alpha-maltose-1-phosphate synthase